MVSWLSRIRFRRAVERAQASDLPSFLTRYLECPVPNYDGPAVQAPILAVDFETNGLNPMRDHLLSVGSVALDDGAIPVGSKWHTLVVSRRDLDAEAVQVHGITHDMLGEGMALDAALEGLFSHLEGRFMLAHHAPVEVGFLQVILKKRYGVHVPFAVIDTCALEARVQSRAQHALSTRLLEARKRYGLPSYSNHHALTDALAAGELFLAQCAHHFSDAGVRDLLTYYP